MCTNGFSQVPNFSAVGSQSCKKGKLNPHNSKAEVDIDFVLTTFNTIHLAQKYNVINFSQVVPQVRINWQSASLPGPLFYGCTCLKSIFFVLDK